MEVFFIILLSCFMIAAAFAVVLLENPVHSALFLVCALFNSALLLFCLGADFLGFVFLLVYVGAVAVFFLLVIMLLNVKHNPSKLTFVQYGPVAAFICFLFLFDFIVPFIQNGVLLNFQPYSPDIFYSPASDVTVVMSNIKLFGGVLYTDFFVFFLILGIVLLIAVLSAVLLTYAPSTSLGYKRAGSFIKK